MDRELVSSVARLLEPSEEQKARMLGAILERRRSGELERGGSRGRFAAAAVAAYLIATTALAVCVGLDGAFLDFLAPQGEEQTERLAAGACALDKRVEDRGGTLEIRQAVGDGNLTYVLMDFTAAENVSLDLGGYRFGGTVDVDVGRSFRSIGFTLLEDGDPADNHLTMVMSITTQESLAGRDIALEFTGLQGADPGERFEVVVPGQWRTSFRLDFTPYSTEYPVDRAVELYGYEAAVKSVSVSPISVAVKVESPHLEEIYRAAGGLSGPGGDVDRFPITIRYRDGTSETTDVFHGTSWMRYPTGEMLLIKTFEGVINDREIRSVSFFDLELPLDQ